MKRVIMEFRKTERSGNKQIPITVMHSMVARNAPLPKNIHLRLDSVRIRAFAAEAALVVVVVDVTLVIAVVIILSMAAAVVVVRRLPPDTEKDEDAK
jgi:hypothetical protein